MNQDQAEQNTSSPPVAEVSTLRDKTTLPLGLALPDLRPLLEEIAHLRHDFETKVKYDESKERLIDSLHRELQAQREGLTFRILRPLFLDLIGLYDEFDTLLAYIRLQETPDGREALTSETSAQILKHMSVFQENIEDILYRHGVEVFTVDDEIFLPSRQRNIRTIPTTEPSQNKKIARRVRKGFLYEQSVLRPEMVELYKYVPAKE
jgi:molecular chaperone GrpE